MATTDSTPGTPTATSGPLPRYVPGAPAPVAPSKNQKKKRQSKLKTLAASAHDSALTDHAPDAEDIKAGKVDPSLLANPAPASSAGPDTGNNTDAEDIKPADKEKSVVVEAIAKRIKGLGKKVQRVNEYKSQTEKLNEDQKAAIAGLSNLEAGIKELEGIKKTIETLETTSRRAQAQERAEEQKANEQRVAEAAQHAEAALLPRITSLLSFLALRDLLTHATPTDLSISEPERHAILSAGDVLLAHPPLGHVEEVVKGFLSGAGSWENVDYGRLVEITSQFAAPRPGTPIPDPSIPLDPTTEHIEPPSEIPEEPEAEPAAEAEPEAEPEAEVEPEVVADLGLPAHATAGGGFHFMQESELDAPGMSESQEWVAVQPDAAVDTAEDEEQGEDYGEVAREAEAAQDLVATSNAAGGAPLDWAAHDEGDELPSLDSLQAKFGGSGSATPVAQPTAPATAPPPAAAPAPAPEDDGFSTIPNRRGHGTRGSFGGDRPYRSRGRGRGGFRGEGGEGGEGGGYRGRGGYRGGSGEGGEGGEGGGYRGRGGYRGGDGEGRGGYRGGDGEGRGGYRGDGEGGYRGRGRGFGGGWGQGQEGGRGGRGGYRGGRGEGRGSGFRGGNGGRGAAPGTPTAETTA